MHTPAPHPQHSRPLPCASYPTPTPTTKPNRVAPASCSLPSACHFASRLRVDTLLKLSQDLLRVVYCILIPDLAPLPSTHVRHLLTPLRPPPPSVVVRILTASTPLRSRPFAQVWQLPAATRALLEARLALRGRSEAERQMVFLLRGLMEWCIYPPQVHTTRPCARSKPQRLLANPSAPQLSKVLVPMFLTSMHVSLSLFAGAATPRQHPR